jgi:putative ABC transport system permease protein
MEVAVGEGLAEALGLAPGGELALFGVRLRVSGVVRLGGVYGTNSAILQLAAVQELLEREGKITVLNLRVAGGHEDAVLEAARARLTARFPQLVFTPAREAAQHNELFRLWRSSAWATSLVGLALGLVIVVNTLLVAVLERTREIGVLVAVGWSRARILALVLLESLLLSAVGGVLGMVVGQVGLEMFVDHPKLRGFVAVAPSAVVFARQLVVIVLLGIAAGLYPAWRAVRLNPVDALRDQ